MTGGAGFLGSRVVRRLLELGWSVAVLDNLSSSAPIEPEVAKDPNFHLHVTDVRDEVATKAVLLSAQPNLVIHLAALHFIPACVQDPVTTLQINVVGTQNVLDGSGELPVIPRFVLASTADVYAPSTTPHDESSLTAPDNVYGLSKLTAEGLVTIAGRQGRCLPLICRLFNLYGSKETNPHVIPEIVDQLRAGATEIRLGNTTPRRDFVHVGDAADAIIQLSGLAPEGLTVNVGTGASSSIDEVIEVIRRLTGRDIPVVTDTERWRASDRPVLESNSKLLRSLLPGALPTSLSSGLRQLLIEEDISVLDRSPS